MIAFYYEKEGTVVLMQTYAGYPFCTYQDVIQVCVFHPTGGDNTWKITMRDGTVAYVTCEIMEWRK